MNSLQISLSILGAILYLVGFVPYIYHAFHGRVIPHAFTWTVGAILSWINTLALIESTGLDASVVTPVVRSSALIVGAIVGWMMLRRITVNKWDYIAISLAIVAIGCAYFFGASQVIVVTILIDILVLLPTLRKIWRDPDTEDAFAWILVVASQACILLSLSHHTLENSLFWVYVMSVNALVALLIVRRRIYTHRWIYRLRHIFSR
jgi:hypothetical protein